MKKNLFAYVQIVLWLVIVGLVAHFSADSIFHLTNHSSEPELSGEFLSLALMLLLSFVSYYIAREKPIPTFVSALLVGIVAKPLLLPLVESHVALGLIVTLGATFILFQGGLETAVRSFVKLLPKIMMLAFPGVVLTALGMSFSISGIGSLLGISVSVTTAVLLGAVLASTDPAAIVPLLKPLRFKNGEVKDIVVSESAMNDVVGALLTINLIDLALHTGGFTGIAAGYGTLWTMESLSGLVTQMVFGIIAGVVGYGLLRFFSSHKEGHDFEAGADGAFFLFVPVFAFVSALVFGGSGFLATFIAGLLFNMATHLKHTAHFYDEHLIDGYAKPAIFLLLGALVDPATLLHYAPIGLLISLIFIFVLRPLVVFVSLGLFTLVGKERISWQELSFISWVRETGAIPAVLLVTVVSRGIPGTEALLPIGLWVILSTLILQPPLTPWWARVLGLVEKETEVALPVEAQQA
jgi:NhaP-type Na+/H+ or K+/H+ antiporter